MAKLTPRKPKKSLKPVQKATRVKKHERQDTTKAKNGLSLKKLLRSTPRYIHGNAEDVVVKKYNGRAVTKGGYPAVTGVCVDIIASQRPHKCSIVGLDKAIDDISNQKRVLVSCSCEFFMFYCEYALWTHGAAKIIYSNGQPAVTTNPQSYPLLCKHLTKLGKLVLKKGD